MGGSGKTSSPYPSILPGVSETTDVPKESLLIQKQCRAENENDATGSSPWSQIAVDLPSRREDPPSEENDVQDSTFDENRKISGSKQRVEHKAISSSVDNAIPKTGREERGRERGRPRQAQRDTPCVPLNVEDRRQKAQMGKGDQPLTDEGGGISRQKYASETTTLARRAATSDAPDHARRGRVRFPSTGVRLTWSASKPEITWGYCLTTRLPNKILREQRRPILGGYLPALSYQLQCPQRNGTRPI